MRNGKIRIKTLVKFLRLCTIARDRNRPLVVQEVMLELNCCKSNAYNYVRALDKLFSSMLA